MFPMYKEGHTSSLPFTSEEEEQLIEYRLKVVLSIMHNVYLACIAQSLQS